jgi:hypothetical protein
VRLSRSEEMGARGSRKNMLAFGIGVRVARNDNSTESHLKGSNGMLHGYLGAPLEHSLYQHIGHCEARTLSVEMKMDSVALRAQI